jgi:hypothetical protein
MAFLLIAQRGTITPPACDYQRRMREPSNAPIAVTMTIASVNQAATKIGESSGQCEI